MSMITPDWASRANPYANAVYSKMTPLLSKAPNLSRGLYNYGTGYLAADAALSVPSAITGNGIFPMTSTAAKFIGGGLGAIFDGNEEKEEIYIDPEILYGAAGAPPDEDAAAPLVFPNPATGSRDANQTVSPELLTPAQQAKELLKGLNRPQPMRTSTLPQQMNERNFLR